jgi:hypothetical protein
VIVGIVAAGTGVDFVRDFRRADDTAQGLADFVASYTPPLNPADFIAFDSGWGAWQSPGYDLVWGYDRDASTLVAIDPPPDPEFAAASKLQPGTVTSQTWETIDGLVTSAGASGFEMRISKGDGTPMSSPYPHADTGGAWEIFSFYSDQPPDLGAQVYTLDARLNGAASAEIRFASLSLSVNKAKE